MMKIQNNNRFFTAAGLLMAASEILKQLILTFCINEGAYDWWYFPFQLCSIPMYLLLILPWVKNYRVTKAIFSFLMCYGLLGGIAVFADTSGLHYPLPILTVHSYLWHLLLIAVGILTGKRWRREHASKKTARGQSPKGAAGYQSFKDATLIYLSSALTAALLNHFLDRFGNINMFYINPDYTMRQVGFADLVNTIGNLPTIFVYMLSTILGAFLFFLLWKKIPQR